MLGLYEGPTSPTRIAIEKENMKANRRNNYANLSLAEWREEERLRRNREKEYEVGNQRQRFYNYGGGSRKKTRKAKKSLKSRKTRK